MKAEIREMQQEPEKPRASGKRPEPESQKQILLHSPEEQPALQTA